MAGSISLLSYMNQVEEPMRKGLIQKVTNESIFLKLLRFVPVDGFSYEYGEQTTLGGVAFRNLNGTYNPDTGVVNPKIETLAIFGGQVNTDIQLGDLRGGVARTNAILAKTRKVGLHYDRYVIDGDPAVLKGSFYGLNARLTNNQLLYPVADAGNGGVLALSDVDRLLDAVAGPNEKKALVMCKADRRKLKQLVVAAAGGAHVEDVGKSLPSYDNCPIQVIDEDGDETPILAKDETRGSSNVTSSMYCIRPGEDPEGEWVQGLMGVKTIGYYPSPPIGTQIIDVIEMLGGLGVFHGRAAARLAGIL